eukprot:Nk52_evm33s914 gene=Nk52_evmTU33s914
MAASCEETNSENARSSCSENAAKPDERASSGLLVGSISDVFSVSSLKNLYSTKEKSFSPFSLLFSVVEYIELFMMRIMLVYRGWVFHPHAWSSKLYFGILSMMKFRKPDAMYFQSCLPRLPVPNLKDTAARFLKSVHPMLNKEEYAETKAKVRESLGLKGYILQTLLVLRAWNPFCANWVQQWWLDFAYLYSRQPLPFNSNYYFTDCMTKPPPGPQVKRAAYYLRHCVAQYFGVVRKAPPVLRAYRAMDIIPVCMQGYKANFGTTRIPGLLKDELVQYPDTKHAVVFRKDVPWKVMLVSENDEIYPLSYIESQLQYIIENTVENGDPVGVFTSENRTRWAEIRNNLEKLSQRNRETLAAIDEAVLCISLEDFSIPNAIDNARDIQLHYMWGGGHNKWFDKINAICFADGRLGGNMEHTPVDASVPGHPFEHFIASEKYDDSPVRPLAGPAPIGMGWDLNADLKDALEIAFKKGEEHASKFDFQLMYFHEYGKEFIKAQKVSPDGFLQCAIQLAYFKLTGKFALTYESASTRQFLNGRTETIRSCSDALSEFVRGMENTMINDKDRKQLLVRACKNHVRLAKEASEGLGVDRHLMGLRILSMATGIELPLFESSGYNLPFTLSTSQTPIRYEFTGKRAHLFPEEKHNAGGGFGAVADDGFGVSYFFYANKLHIHCSSRSDKPTENVERMIESIKTSLMEMRKMCIRANED